MAGRLYGWATQFLPLPRAPSVVSHFGGYINAQGYYPWVKICSTENFSLDELDFEYPTIKSLRAPNNSAIVLKNSNHNNRRSLICGISSPLLKLIAPAVASSLAKVINCSILNKCKSFRLQADSSTLKSIRLHK